MKLSNKDKSFLKKTIPAASFIGGLCCFSPLILVLLGLTSVSFAASFADTLYGQYKWIFRSAAILFLLLALGWHIYKKEKLCSLEQLKRQRRKVLNLVLSAISLGVIGYVIWLYVIVEIAGVL